MPACAAAAAAAGSSTLPVSTTCPPAPHLRRMDILPIILPSLYPDNLQHGQQGGLSRRWVIDYLIVNCPVKRSTQKPPATEKRIFSGDYLENCSNQSSQLSN